MSRSEALHVTIASSHRLTVSIWSNVVSVQADCCLGASWSRANGTQDCGSQAWGVGRGCGKAAIEPQHLTDRKQT